MKSLMLWIIVALAVIAGGWYWWSMSAKPATDTGPSMAAGINDSPDQDTKGQTGPSMNPTGSAQAGQVQQPMADGAEGSVIGNNFALGIVADDIKFTSYLIAYNDMALYTFDKDTGSVSTCYDACAHKWPPYIVGPEDNLEHVPAGLDDTLIGTTKRTDGTLQLTYKGHPVDFYADDKTSADVNGDGVGGVWHVAKP